MPSEADQLTVGEWASEICANETITPYMTRQEIHDLVLSWYDEDDCSMLKSQTVPIIDEILSMIAESKLRDDQIAFADRLITACHDYRLDLIADGEGVENEIRFDPLSRIQDKEFGCLSDEDNQTLANLTPDQRKSIGEYIKATQSKPISIQPNTAEHFQELLEGRLELLSSLCERYAHVLTPAARNRVHAQVLSIIETEFLANNLQ